MPGRLHPAVHNPVAVALPPSQVLARVPKVITLLQQALRERAPVRRDVRELAHARDVAVVPARDVAQPGVQAHRARARARAEPVRERENVPLVARLVRETQARVGGQAARLGGRRRRARRRRDGLARDRGLRGQG